MTLHEPQRRAGAQRRDLLQDRRVQRSWWRYDELDLPAGVVRLKQGGGARRAQRHARRHRAAWATISGACASASAIPAIATQVLDYVLGARHAADERRSSTRRWRAAADACRCCCTEGAQNAMNRLHGRDHARAVSQLEERYSSMAIQAAASSVCRTSASRRCSMRSRARRSRPRTTRSAPSTRTSASCRCPIRGSTQLAAIVQPEKIVPTTVEFVDIAGLVAGASQGEGLGNKFLAHIREVDAIAHVVRCFESTRHRPRRRPRRSALGHRRHRHRARARRPRDAWRRRLDRAAKAAKSGDKDAMRRRDAVRARARCSSMRASRCAPWQLTAEERRDVRELQLLTREAGHVRRQRRRERLHRTTRCSAAVEKRAARGGRGRGGGVRRDRGRDRAARGSRAREFLAELGLEEPGLNRVIRAAYRLLGLQTYLHRRARRRCAPGPCASGATAPQAAGVIHTDFERGFIRAEVIALRGFHRRQGRGGREGCRQAAPRGQGVRRPGRRRHALPVQRLMDA